jgi:putative copper export protein
MHHIYLILHLIGACVWVGGHLLLLFRYLPFAIKHNAPEVITAFEKKFEPVGIPALLLQIITGIAMSYNYNVGASQWFHFENSIEKTISIKLILLMATLLLALHARIFIIPKLNQNNLIQLAWHIVLVNILAIAMLVIGSFIRFGGV